MTKKRKTRTSRSSADEDSSSERSTAGAGAPEPRLQRYRLRDAVHEVLMYCEMRALSARARLVNVGGLERNASASRSKSTFSRLRRWRSLSGF